MPRPRIGLLTEDYLPRIGGIAGHVHELARALHRTDFEPVVITTIGAAEDQNAAENFGVVRIPPRFPQRQLFRAAELHARLPRTFREQQIALVHWHTMGPICGVLRRTGLPKVFTNHSSKFLSRLAVGRTRRLHRKISHADALIAPSQELRAGTIAVGCDAAKTHYIPNGVDADLFQPGDQTAARRQLELPEEGTVVLCARRIVEKNGIKYWAEALADLAAARSDATFLFAGDHDGALSPYEKDVYARLESLHDNKRVIYLGPCDRARMRCVYQAADVSVLPSLVEATSLTALESMASGVPVVATNIGGLPEIITNGEQGLLVPARDSKALANAVRRLQDETDLAKRLAAAALTRTRAEFSWDAVVEQTTAVYRSVLETP